MDFQVEQGEIHEGTKEASAPCLHLPIVHDLAELLQRRVWIALRETCHQSVVGVLSHLDLPAMSSERKVLGEVEVVEEGVYLL